MNAFEIAAERFSLPDSGQVDPVLMAEFSPDHEVPATKIEEAPLSEPVQPLTEEDRARLTAQWASTPLIDMLPAGRRAEAEEILKARPELRRLLHMCKLAVIDCWQVMEHLGMDAFGPGEVAL